MLPMEWNPIPSNGQRSTWGAGSWPQRSIPTMKRRADSLSSSMWTRWPSCWNWGPLRRRTRPCNRGWGNSSTCSSSGSSSSNRVESNQVQHRYQVLNKMQDNLLSF